MHQMLLTIYLECLYFTSCLSIRGGLTSSTGVFTLPVRVYFSSSYWGWVYSLPSHDVDSTLCFFPQCCTLSGWHSLATDSFSTLHSCYLGFVTYLVLLSCRSSCLEYCDGHFWRERSSSFFFCKRLKSDGGLQYFVRRCTYPCSDVLSEQAVTKQQSLSPFLTWQIPSVRGVTTDLQNKRIATIHKRVVAAQREGHLTACELDNRSSSSPTLCLYPFPFPRGCFVLPRSKFQPPEKSHFGLFVMHHFVRSILFDENKLLTLSWFPVMPQLLEDSRKVMEKWGNSGKFDPFEKIYEVSVFSFVISLSSR